ncbi:MAG: PAS domain-containing sensor histidine kinase [Myxococcota bacterium]|nr:PAS domain-containing sensor histidine kinase [Myxococcota bacterium]
MNGDDQAAHPAEAGEKESRDALFRAVFEGASDAILLADDQRRFVDANRAACELLGVSRESLLGSTIEEFAAPSFDVGGTWAGFVAANALEGEFPLQRPDGERRLVWFRAVTNVLPGIHLSILRDISEQERHARFRELFLGMVGHDLRNPLSAIITGATLLLRPGTLTPDQTRTATRIHSSGQRMVRMIDQLLDFTRTRLGSGLPMDRASVDLRKVAERIIDEMKQAQPAARIELTTRGETTGEWDGALMEQVFSNLLGNAIEHGDAEAVQLTMVGEPAALRVRLHNRGEPIPSSLVPNLFDPFRRTPKRTKGRSQGLGLGLYISQQIVQQHGGTITVSSCAEEGTTFEIVLPYAPKPVTTAIDGTGG